VEEVAYGQFEALEDSHWWLRARRTLFFDLLDLLLPAQRPLRSLDVGCGYGAMLGELSRYGAATGLEVSEQAVEACRRRGFEDVLLSSAYSVPEPDESFDVVSFFDCLEHLEDDRAALREARRLLRPGGHVVVTLPAYNFLYANNDRVAHHQRRYTVGEIRSKLEASGFRLRKATYVNALLFPLILPIVLLKKLRERLLPRAGDTSTNLSRVPPRPLNEALYRIFASERLLLRRASFPAGHSIFALAVKERQREPRQQDEEGVNGSSVADVARDG
jgi:SAM-dependent methyltransferase